MVSRTSEQRRSTTMSGPPSNTYVSKRVSMKDRGSLDSGFEDEAESVQG
jgi:hypothetical protein